ncbi:MAG: M48 family metallopeptidase [Ignavibacteria bacterium]|nr:M48 family metallopeptidase [Ignavibacteria bacterium]
MTVQESYAGIKYEIRKRTQAKRMSLKVSHDGRVWVSVPMRASLKDARSFMEKNIAFVQATLDKVAAERSQKTLEKPNAPLEVLVEGEWLRLMIAPGEKFTMNISHDSDGILALQSRHLLITVPSEKISSEENAHSAAMQYWRYTMIHRANEILPTRTLALAESFGEPVRRIAVKDQKSLWGSCVKARRSVNLNWRCILFPPPVLDYLIIHELAHLRQANHSQAYWQQVEAWCPTYKESEKWLKANGRRIMALTA